MYVEAHYTGNEEEYVDRMVALDPTEDRLLEIAFMVGAGVRCRRTATEYSDPLQKGYPRTYSVEATETIIKGLYKIADGDSMGYFGVKPREARHVIAQSLQDRQSVVPLLFVEDEIDWEQGYMSDYGQNNNAN